ncbi:hypothetical protein [uncultured Winogradskyella sp.]|uniref:hypothetical protein n=1 Tax=uncultured Winogradskyella sp. TaxID=395353 RepID=UPI0035197908
MKKIYLLLTLVLGIFMDSYAQGTTTEEQQKEFKEITQTFQSNYMEGSENCESIIHAFDKKVKMSENRFSQQMTMTYEQLVQFCPHLPKKEVINTVTEQRLLSSELGYDYVSQLYLRKSVGDTVRETSSRIWELKDGGWKIIQMNSSLNKHCD